MHMCASVEHRAQHGLSSSVSLHLTFEVGFLMELVALHWLASEPQRSSCLSQLPTQIFCVGLELKLRSLTFYTALALFLFLFLS